MASGNLSGKVAVVTGASKGIGASIALHLAQAGAKVVVNYSSSAEGANRVVGELVGNGGKAVAIQANLSKEADVRRLFAESEKALGLLCNASGLPDTRSPGGANNELNAVYRSTSWRITAPIRAIRRRLSGGSGSATAPRR